MAITQKTVTITSKVVSLKISTIVQSILQAILNSYLKIVLSLEYQPHRIMIMVAQFTPKIVNLFITEFVHSTVRPHGMDNIAIVKHLKDHSKIT